MSRRQKVRQGCLAGGVINADDGILEGCYPCSRRRIHCDRTEPSCKKCDSRGLKCIGLGLRVRFSLAAPSRSRLARPQKSPNDVGAARGEAQSARNKCQALHVTDDDAAHRTTHRRYADPQAWPRQIGALGDVLESARVSILEPQNDVAFPLLRDGSTLIGIDEYAHKPWCRQTRQPLLRELDAVPLWERLMSDYCKPCASFL